MGAFSLIVVINLLNRRYAQQQRVSWKKFAVTVCPSFLSRNKILENKLKHFGKKVTLSTLDIRYNFPSFPDSHTTEKNSSPYMLLSSDSLELNETDFQEFSREKKTFDIFDMEQLVLVLQNRFASINIPLDYGIVLGFICNEASADDKHCLFKCDEAFRSIRKSLGNWRCKAFTEYLSSTCKLIQRRQDMNPIPFLYETWWFPYLVDQFRLEKQVSLCPISSAEVDIKGKTWTNGNDIILVSPLDRPKLDRSTSSVVSSSRSSAHSRSSDTQSASLSVVRSADSNDNSSYLQVLPNVLPVNKV